MMTMPVVLRSRPRLLEQVRTRLRVQIDDAWCGSRRVMVVIGFGTVMTPRTTSLCRHGCCTSGLAPPLSMVRVGSTVGAWSAGPRWSPPLCDTRGDNRAQALGSSSFWTSLVW